MDEQRVVLFEVCPTPQGRKRYLELAAALRPLLEDFDGLVRMERFASLNQEGKLLSMNVWRDEASLERWRKAAEHRLCQQEGREQLFESYRITVCAPVRSYTDRLRDQAPADSRAALDGPETQEA